MASNLKSQPFDISQNSSQEESICWEELDPPKPQVEPIYQWPFFTARQFRLCSPLAFEYKCLDQMLSNDKAVREMEKLINIDFPALPQYTAQSSAETMMRDYSKEIKNLIEKGFMMIYCAEQIQQMKQMLETQSEVLEMLENSLLNNIRANINYLQLSRQRILPNKYDCDKFFAHIYKKYIGEYLKQKDKIFSVLPKEKLEISYLIYKSYQGKSFGEYTINQYKALHEKRKIAFNEQQLENLCVEKQALDSQFGHQLVKLQQQIFSLTSDAINRHVLNTKAIYGMSVLHDLVQSNTPKMRAYIREFQKFNEDSKPKDYLEKELQYAKERIKFLTELLNLSTK